MDEKARFKMALQQMTESLSGYVESAHGDWSIKGFIDIYKNIYTVSGDTKIISKILELHLFPRILEFAEDHGYQIVLADHQNYYPDISFIFMKNDKVKFALDLKTTYRLESNPKFCNGFTLGSHGEYFINRMSTKNIQFPYSEYLGHYCLGVIYTRAVKNEINEARVYPLSSLESIVSVINNFRFFVCEKWKIASDRSGSGNTANIGSINYISDLVSENGIFLHLGEQIFDEYWMNYGRMIVTDAKGRPKKLSKLTEFLAVKGLDQSLVNARQRMRRIDG